MNDELLCATTCNKFDSKLVEHQQEERQRDTNQAAANKRTEKGAWVGRGSSSDDEVL